MDYNEKAIDILGESLEQHKKAIEGIQKNISDNKSLSSKAVEALTLEMKKELLKVDNTMKSYIDSIRVPKDGEDAVVDYQALQDFIVKEVLKVDPEKVDYSKVQDYATVAVGKIEAERVDYEKIDSKIEEEVSRIPKPENGISPKIDYTKVNQEVMAQFPKAAIVEEIEKKIPKQEVVVGLKIIKVEKDDLVIITTDGKKQKFPLSFKKLNMFGGGTGYDDTGIKKAINDLKQVIKEVSSDYTALSEDSALLVDCSGGDVIITLPLASTRNKTLDIKRIDDTLNVLRVVTTDSELIDREDSIELLPFENLPLVPSNTQYYIR